MFKGKSIFPWFAVDRPMPTATQAPRATVVASEYHGRQLPLDIANAVSHATFTAFIVGLGTCDDLEIEEQARIKFRAARADLDAVILKHLRGEA